MDTHLTLGYSAVLMAKSEMPNVESRKIRNELNGKAQVVAGSVMTSERCRSKSRTK